MPLKKIPLPPGFDKNDTPSQAEGRWIDGDNAETKGSKENIYDKRLHLGLPSWFKK